MLPTVSACATYVKPMDALYTRKAPEVGKTKVKFIPYHAFANRGAFDMQVWMLF